MSWAKANEHIPPCVGDIVRLPMYRGIQRGIVVDNTCETGWCDVLLDDGELVKWPTVQLQVVIPRELSDEQLENVVGGMSPQTFDEWKARMFNESD